MSNRLEKLSADEKLDLIAAIAQCQHTEARKIIFDREEKQPVTLTSEQGKELIQENPTLAGLKEQYEKIRYEHRVHKGTPRTWAEVCNAIPDMADFLAGVETLQEAQVCFLNEQGQLVLIDGCAEPVEESLGMNYHVARNWATRITWRYNKGEISTTNGDGIKIPYGSRVMTERGLVKLNEEYECINNGQFDRVMGIWTESGKNPTSARYALWNGDKVACRSSNPDAEYKSFGARRVLRVNLNFGS